jgi:hypothetical protein
MSSPLAPTLARLTPELAGTLVLVNSPGSLVTASQLIKQFLEGAVASPRPATVPWAQVLGLDSEWRAPSGRTSILQVALRQFKAC